MHEPLYTAAEMREAEARHPGPVGRYDGPGDRADDPGQHQQYAGTEHHVVDGHRPGEPGTEYLALDPGGVGQPGEHRVRTLHALD